jgi:hypothetical protein
VINVILIVFWAVTCAVVFGICHAATRGDEAERPRIIAESPPAADAAVENATVRSPLAS